MCMKEEILLKLNEQRVTQKSIARFLNVSPSLITNVIHGRSRSAKVENVLTKLTGYEFPKSYKSENELAELLQAK